MSFSLGIKKALCLGVLGLKVASRVFPRPPPYKGQILLCRLLGQPLLVWKDAAKVILFSSLSPFFWIQ